MKLIKTNLLVRFEMELMDAFKEDITKEEIKKEIQSHIKMWCLYHKISEDNVKIIPCNKKKRFKI